MAIVLRKWGNSIGMLLPRQMTDKYLYTKDGGKLHVFVDKDALVLSVEEKEGIVNYEVAISKWGNGLGIRIPKPVLQELRMKDGDLVDVFVEDKKQLKFKKFKQLSSKIVFRTDLALEDGTVIKKGTDAGDYVEILDLSE